MSEVHPITFRLKVFNAWRRGNDAPQPDPKTVGEDIDSICDLAHRLEREREAERALAEMYRRKCSRLALEHEALQEQLDAAIMLGKMQERRHERELEQVREQYRLSSVYRKLLEGDP